MSTTPPQPSGAQALLGIRSIAFSRFRALHETAIDINTFNLLIGANGSGKSTVIGALRDIGATATVNPNPRPLSRESGGATIAFERIADGAELTVLWQGDQLSLQSGDSTLLPLLQEFLAGIRCYQWEAEAIIDSVRRDVADSIDPGLRGEHFAAALRNISRKMPQVFAAWKEEFILWFPEYRDVRLNDTQVEVILGGNSRALGLADLSEGTLHAMTTLLISHAPVATFICLEEPDRTITPRLLCNLRDALYRLAFPQQFDLDRAPIQVVATTHSPYLVDLFKDCPEQIRITSKDPSGHVQIRRLTDTPELLENLGDASLGEVWFSGIFDA